MSRRWIKDQRSIMQTSPSTRALARVRILKYVLLIFFI
jgi:hypothetical protein